jgi:hypothetical protein
MAPWTTYTQLKHGRIFGARGQGFSTATAQLVLAWMQTMPHTDTFVKNKTLTLPQAFLWRNKL